MKQGDSPYDINVDVWTATEQQTEVLRRETTETAPWKHLMQTFAQLLHNKITTNTHNKLISSIGRDHNIQPLYETSEGYNNPRNPIQCLLKHSHLRGFPTDRVVERHSTAPLLSKTL